MIKVETIEILKSLPSTPEEGEQALIEKTHELYEFHNGEWGRCGNTTINVSLYEINKQAMAKAPMLTDEVLADKKRKLKNYIERRKNQYYMLLCKDISYYTLFVRNCGEGQPIEEDVIECIKDLGAPLSIEKTEDKVYEIWFKNEDGVFAAYFFPYDLGVIKCQ